jgi:hypothetical protein
MHTNNAYKAYNKILFPFSEGPTKITATQKNLLPHLVKNYFLNYFFSFVLYMTSVNVSNNVVIKHWSTNLNIS